MEASYLYKSNYGKKLVGMNSSIVIGDLLKSSATKYGMKQKEIAKSVGYANATTNGHFNGNPVSSEAAIHYAKEFNDSEFNWMLSKELLGLIGIINGNGVRQEVLALGVLQRREAAERKAVEKQLEIEYLMTIPEEDLTKSQQESILIYLLEYADELLFEISHINSHLELLGMSFMDLMKIKIPVWEERKWIQ